LVTGNAETLARAMPIETGSVRSRRIFVGAGVTVVALTLDAGTVMKEHLSTAPILLQVLEGHVVLDVRRDRIDMTAGSLVHVEAQLRHTVEALEPSRVLLFVLAAHAA